jgi:hypothetical protein
MEIGTEAAQFPKKEYTNGIFVAVHYKRDDFAYDLMMKFWSWLSWCQWCQWLWHCGMDDYQDKNIDDDYRDENGDANGDDMT